MGIVFLSQLCPVQTTRQHLEKGNGRIPKWPTGADCKSAGFAFTGSNPVPTTTFSGDFSKSTTSRTNSAQKNAKFPVKIFYRGQTATIDW
jgi:hypothetical protein